MFVTLTREQAAERCACSLSHFKRHVQPHLPAVRIGGLVRFDQEDLDRWLENQKDGGSSAKEAGGMSDTATKGAAQRSPAARRILAKLRSSPPSGTPKPSRGRGKRAA